MKRIISIVLLACLLCGLFVGCKAKKQANSATDVEIVYWETGYGRGWLDALVKNFNESQDVYYATVVASAENRISEIERGNATGDLYFGAWNTFNAYKEYLYPMDTLLATKVDGENGLTIGEKFGDLVCDRRGLCRAFKEETAEEKGKAGSDQVHRDTADCLVGFAGHRRESMDESE